MASEVTIKIEGDIKGYQKALKQASSQTEALEGTLASAAKISAVAFAGLGATIVGVASQAAKFETIGVQLEVLTGSSEKAAASMKALNEFSSKTPFQFEDIAKAGQKLLAFGFQADELPGLLQQIGDVAAVTGKPIGELSVIFGQISAAGKLTGERFNQLIEAGVNVGPALAQALGEPETKLRDLIAAGKVTDEVFKKAFASLSQKGGPAFQGLTKLSRSLEGKISTLKDNFQQVAVAVGQNFVPALKVAADGLNRVLLFIRENPEITKTAAAFLAVGTALAGLTTALATAGVLFLKLRAAMIAAGGAVKILTIGVRGLVGATGLGLLLLVVTDLALNFDKRMMQIKTAFEGLSKFITAISGDLGKVLIGVFAGKFDLIKEGVNGLKQTFKQGFDDIVESVSSSEEKITENQKAGADARRDIASSEAEKAKAQREAEFQEKITEAAERFELEEEQKAEFRTLAKEFEEQHQFDLLAARLAVQQEGAKADKKANAERLKEQVKFGKAFADINKVINSDQVQGVKQATGELVALQQSSNSTLKTIGKAAAVAQITIKTAESAMNIYTGFSTIPIVGPALGIAGAAAAVAFGAEQIARVTAAQEGGLITGGIAGADSVPALLTPGELVVPQSNFEEVVNAVSEARGIRTDQEVGSEEEGAGGGAQVVQIGFDGPEASQVLTARQNEDRALGISREA